jgi:hypothetical protein
VQQVIPLDKQGQSHTEDRPERRDHSRYPVDEDAGLVFAGQDGLQAARIVDLSQEGCRVRSKERLAFRSGWPVEVSFKVSGVVFQFSGMLQWADSGSLLGVHFVNVNPQRAVELANVICEMEAGEKPRTETESKAVVDQAGAERTDRQGGIESAPHRGDCGGETAKEHQAAPPAISGGVAEAKPPAAQAAMSRYRRGNARHDVDTSASILLVNVGSTLRGRILDLSLGGCRIRTDERFPVGIYTRVETEFRLEGLAFRLGGVIQAIHDRNTVGIRFLDLSERKRQQVQDLIGEIEELRAAQVPVEIGAAAERA